MNIDLKTLSFGDFWSWAVDFGALLILLTFLVGRGDLLDFMLALVVVVPRIKKFSEIENGLIGYLKRRFDFTIPQIEE